MPPLPASFNEKQRGNNIKNETIIKRQESKNKKRGKKKKNMLEKSSWPGTSISRSQTPRLNTSSSLTGA